MTENIAKRNYEAGLWTEYQLKLAVKAKIITAEIYRNITGNEYSE